MRYCESVEEALKYFLKSAPHERNGSDYSRRYCVCGSMCVIRKMDGIRGTPPMFKWLEHIPEEYRGMDVTNYLRNDYLKPFGAPNMPPPAPVDIIAKRRADLVHGQVVHKTDTQHYEGLLARLNDKQLFGEHKPCQTN